jgi:hypothetical protein
MFRIDLAQAEPIGRTEVPCKQLAGSVRQGDQIAQNFDRLGGIGLPGGVSGRHRLPHGSRAMVAIGPQRQELW